MKRIFYIFFFLVVFVNPSTAEAVYRIEVLQAGKSPGFEAAYQGIVRGLENAGLFPAEVKIARTIVEVNPDAEPYTWENLRVLMKIKMSADRIIGRGPDLVITLGTPATKFARLKIAAAGIPLVFSCVAEPEVVGCLSKTHAGPGFTGVTMYADPAELMRLARQGLPNLKKIGVIHSDDDYASFYADEIKARAGELGLEVLDRQVNLYDKVAPVAEELVALGIDAFFVPMDRYYRLKSDQNWKILMKLSSDRKLPCIASVAGNVKGALLYTSPDWETQGSLAADRATKILRGGVKPEDIPVANPRNQGVLVDAEAFRKLGIELPPKLLSRWPRHDNDRT